VNCRTLHPKLEARLIQLQGPREVCGFECDARLGEPRLYVAILGMSVYRAEQGEREEKNAGGAAQRLSGSGRAVR
jgi:hypothetical protein